MRVKNTVTVNGKRKTCRVYDAGVDFTDRYTIAFRGLRDNQGRMYWPYLASGSAPFHGFGQHGESRHFVNGKHLGKRVSFDSLPTDVKKFILQSI
jgi:hypothetical protein